MNAGKTIGFTSTLGMPHLPKSDILIEALGCLDEANSFIGYAKAQCTLPAIKGILHTVQEDLASIMEIVARIGEDSEDVLLRFQKRLAWLKETIQQHECLEEKPKGFLVPGANPLSAQLDICRVVVRRAERRLSGIYLQDSIRDTTILEYLNALSQLLYLLEIHVL